MRHAAIVGSLADKESHLYAISHALDFTAPNVDHEDTRAPEVIGSPVRRRRFRQIAFLPTAAWLRRSADLGA